jgi:DNA-binding winged helix-turn-helix (wHTH) protein/tetratricopeptide (TPR) repeat protein
MPLTTAVSFDGWTLYPDSGELARAGHTTRLAQQPLRVLIELLEHPGEVVKRERLVEILWPRGVVDFDASLNAAVRKLRGALGDDSETPRYVETLPRIGYRFIGTLDTSVPTASPAPPTRPSFPRTPVLAAIAIVLLLAAWWMWPRSPASPPASQDAAPRRTTSERAYEHYLAGVFHRSRRDIAGSDLSIAEFEAALREDPNYADAWAGLAETLVGADIAQHRPIVPSMRDARTAALRAIELEEGNAQGHTVLGMVYLQFDRDFRAAEAEFNRARSLNDRYARAWHHLGMLRAYQGRVQDAIESVRRARELEPTMPLYAANYGHLLYHARRYEEAIAHIRPLLSVQPRFDQARSVLIRSLVAEGEFKAALEQLPLRVSDAPTLSDAGLVYAHLGRREEALQEISRIERRGAEGYGVAYEIAVIQAALADVPAACAALARAYDDYSQALGWMKLDPRMDALRGEPCFAAVLERLGTG